MALERLGDTSLKKEISNIIIRNVETNDHYLQMIIYVFRKLQRFNQNN